MDVVGRDGWASDSACPRPLVPRGKAAGFTSQLDGDESAKGFWGRVGRQPDSGQTRLAKRTPHGVSKPTCRGVLAVPNRAPMQVVTRAMVAR